jgi:hypothetical protein
MQCLSGRTDCKDSLKIVLLTARQHQYHSAEFQVLDSAKTNLERGRADQVIAELAPILFEKSGSANHSALSSRQSILEGLQLLQVSLCLL